MVNWLNEYDKHGHLVYYATYHIVLATRYGRRILKEGIGEYLKISLKIISRHYPEMRIFEAKTSENYLHLHASISPLVAVNQVISTIRIDTGKALREKFCFLKRIDASGGIWSPGSLISSVKIKKEVIEKYVEYQKDEDHGQTRFEF